MKPKVRISLKVLEGEVAGRDILDDVNSLIKPELIQVYLRVIPISLVVQVYCNERISELLVN